ncbi:TRM11 family methyltransferase [Tessaracoccus sp. ZS01]|uniref:TRM11 family SAM-dependent methyltransferase n=1 Tax=Tessaracoccus sp. ZS01 TaxID=1906324 RepID=UPI00096CFD50|nr:SAM-dependent methyltransferase [Tessaracoccus sp. ZS01]MCG6568251.1 SAM-dependent methyltransferase [Tessaracoccus sp. ZS01]OMG53491.1 SAM-dependent methyltransferase [Tessaracoccus sp. ZS01]
MPRYLMLRTPSANRVYAGESGPLTAAELEITAPFATEIEEQDIAGVGYLAFQAPELNEGQLATVARQSAAFALFEDATPEGLLRPVAMPRPFLFDDDLVTIPKYQGKTNEQFTQLLLSVTLAAITREPTGPRQILDPLAGRGTTLSMALLLGHDAFGVEGDAKAFEMMASFYKTYLRRSRIKHVADTTPVRREGKNVGKRFDAEITTPEGKSVLTAFTGDTRDSAALFGKKRFDAIVADAPYGIAHGSTTDVRGVSGKRDRSPAGLLKEAIPVWAGQLMHGGALGLSWNTFGLSREDLAHLLTTNGLTVQAGGAWERFAHRVDSAIKRDLIVAVKR